MSPRAALNTPRMSSLSYHDNLTLCKLYKQNSPRVCLSGLLLNALVCKCNVRNRGIPASNKLIKGGNSFQIGLTSFHVVGIIRNNNNNNNYNRKLENSEFNKIPVQHIGERLRT